MASYFIIGGDKREYGPISSGDVRQWIIEGRLNSVTEARAENETEWGLLGSIPEFADLLGKATPPNIGPISSVPGLPSMDFVGRDYEMDIGGCVSQGWELFKNNFGILFLSFLIMFLVSAVASGVVTSILSVLVPQSLRDVEAVHLIQNFVLVGLLAVVTGPLAGGMYHVYLRTLRRVPVEVGDVFFGFKMYFKPLFLGYLVTTGINAICMIPFNIVNDAKLMPIFQKMQHQSSPEDLQNTFSQIMPAFMGSLPVLLICLVPVLYFTVTFVFTLPLIVDKQMGFMAAIKTGAKMVHRHWWQVFLLVIVVDLVNVAGLLACCVGLLATVPITTAAMLVAYETIFGQARKN